MEDVIVYSEPEKCPFCKTYNVYHMMPIGDGPTRGCNKCQALWAPKLKITHEYTNAEVVGNDAEILNMIKSRMIESAKKHNNKPIPKYDGRNWYEETIEELLDAMVYITNQLLILKESSNELQKKTRRSKKTTK